LVALVAVGMPQEVARQVVELQTLAAAVAVMVRLWLQLPVQVIWMAHKAFN
jgi:hypothetical protein